MLFKFLDVVNPKFKVMLLRLLALIYQKIEIPDELQEALVKRNVELSAYKQN